MSYRIITVGRWRYQGGYNLGYSVDNYIKYEPKRGDSVFYSSKISLTNLTAGYQLLCF